MGEFPSGQRGQTVNLLLFSFGGPNPPSPTKHKQTSERMSVYVWWARADNRTAFCAAKTWFAETAEKETFSDREDASKQRIAGTASAVEKMRNAEYPPSPFSSFRHPFGCLFVFGTKTDNRTAFCAAKTWFAEAAIFATQKSTVESRMSDFFGNRISGRNSARRSVPTLAVFIFQTSERMSVYVWGESG